jgi:hypothetical protein
MFNEQAHAHATVSSPCAAQIAVKISFANAGEVTRRYDVE